MLPPYHRDRLLDLGFIVVSANYRLCPTITLYEGPVKDSLDAYEWARLVLPGLLKKEGVSADGSRIVVLGHSCGGTLALLTVCAIFQVQLTWDCIAKRTLNKVT